MYSLLNVIKFALMEVQKNSSIKTKHNMEKLEDAHRLDFLCGIYFRVFENLVVQDADDPQRFKLEIYVNKGSTVEPDEVGNIKKHCINVGLDNLFSMTMTLNDVNRFFTYLYHSQEIRELPGQNPNCQGFSPDEVKFKQTKRGISEVQSMTA